MSGRGMARGATRGRPHVNRLLRGAGGVARIGHGANPSPKAPTIVTALRDDPSLPRPTSDARADFEAALPKPTGKSDG